MFMLSMAGTVEAEVGVEAMAMDIVEDTEGMDI